MTNYPSVGSAQRMVSRCHPTWWESQTLTLCEDQDGGLGTRVPATDVTAGVIYRNIYCATCNFADNIQLWNGTIRCMDDISKRTGGIHNTLSTENVLELVNAGDCDLSSRAPTGQLERPCDSRLISECTENNISTTWTEICHSLTLRPVAMYSKTGKGDRFYKNMFCALCSGNYMVNDSAIYCGNTAVFTRRVFLGDFSFAMLVDFSDSGCLGVSIEGLSGRGSYSCDGLHNITCTLSNTSSCLNVSSPHNDTLVTGDTAYSTWMGILTITCISMSIISLLIRAALHPCLPVFHNLAGRTQFCLVITLLVAMITFLIGPFLKHTGLPCLVAGVIMHWSFLSTFFWMNAIAVDMWLVFRPSASFTFHTGRRQFYRLLLFSLYSWALPGICVIPGLSLDLADVHTVVRPFYGRSSCWIYSSTALLIWFCCPVGLLVTVNIVMYSMTARHLHVSMRQTMAITSSGQLPPFWLYVRLLAVMGAGWLMAFLAVFVDHPVTWVMFVVLTASQGVYVSAASLCSKRVYTSIKGSDKPGVIRSRKTSWFSLSSFSESRSNKPRVWRSQSTP